MVEFRRSILNMEAVLFAFFLAITGWILIGSFSLNSSASKLFPQLIGGILVVLYVLFLISKVIPEGVRELLPEHDALTYGADEEGGQEFDERNVAIVFLMFGAYLVGVNFLGLIVATPIYVYANLRYFGYGTRRKRFGVIVTTIVITAIAYELFRISLGQGILMETLFDSLLELL